MCFPYEPLTQAEEKFLRYMIFPEIRVNEFKQDELFALEPQEIKALDLTQESIAKNIGDGHRILKGVAVQPHFQRMDPCSSLQILQHSTM